MKGLRHSNLLKLTAFVPNAKMQVELGQSSNLTVKQLLELKGEPMSLARERVLQVLKEHERYLTTSQIALLFYSVDAQGKPTKSFKIRPKKNSQTVYDLQPGYFSAWRLLRNMARDKEIRQHKIPIPGNSDIWTLPGVDLPTNWYNRQHEEDCADLFCVFKLTGKLLHWDSVWTDPELRKFAKATKIKYDRRFELDGSNQVFFLEVDRGTEDMSNLVDKVKKYKRLADQFPDDRFTVVFTFQGSSHFNLDKRKNTFIKATRAERLVSQFVVVSHDDLIAYPLGRVCTQASHPDTLISLSELS